MNGRYLCKKSYADDDYVNIDFYIGRVYEYKDEYMHSTENGTDVWIPKDELEKYWIKVD